MNALQKTLVAAVCVLMACSQVFGQTQYDQARDIILAMEEQEVVQSAWISGQMIINDRFGEKVSSFESWARGSDYSLIEFTSVEELGQKILRRGDDLYLYYPDADEEIRISGSALRDGILGSDVSYEDMTGEKSLLDDYRIASFGEENLDGQECWVIELEALRSSVPYPRQTIWVDKQRGSGLQSHKFSLNGRLLKTERVLQYIDRDGYHIPSIVEVQDTLKRNSSTRFIIEDISIDIDIDDDMFSREELTW